MPQTIPVFDNVTREDPRSLVPMPDNTQERTRQELDRIKESIRAHGLVGPIVGRPSDRSIAGGHGRLEAVLELVAEGYAIEGGGIPVVWRECDDAELLALNMALNNATGQPSYEKIAIAVRKIEGLGRRDLLDNGATGFTPLQIKDLVILAIEPAGNAPERKDTQPQQRDEDGDMGDDDYDEHLADQMAERSALVVYIMPTQRDVIAQAIKRTGLDNEGDALTVICRAYCNENGQGP